ncbi:MAG: Proline--tRNA ligase [Anaerolineales bacterium]|nr:Proline--tRNA ligase [Anaerolineales bacterium]
MKYTELKIQTQREFPNNARAQGWGWLVRAGYVTRENEILPLGQLAVDKLKNIDAQDKKKYFESLQIPVGTGLVYGHIFYLVESGRSKVFKCGEHGCDYIDLIQYGVANKFIYQPEDQLPVEKIRTPDCNTIEALAKFLGVKESQTAKAMMYTRVSDQKFVFIVMRGDTQLNLHKLKRHIGETRMATNEEIEASGAVPGYASPIGVKNALIIVDELAAHAKNLVAGANEASFHLLNTNCGRDYSPDMVLDVVQVEDSDICAVCEDANIWEEEAEILADENGNFDFINILFALAETHHDDKGLTLPPTASPFDAYLMHVPGKTMDTKAKAEEIYNTLTNAGMSVLFDDRDERAGVKFNDADLIGCPIRLTVGEKGLQNGMVELKKRSLQGVETIPLEQIKIIKTLM